MNAGALNVRVTIQQPQAGSDEFGQPVVGWSDVVAVWASVRHLSGIEAAKSGMDVSSVRASIRIKYRDGITAAMRVMVGSVVYQIKAVMPDLGRRVYVDLVCEQVTG